VIESSTICTALGQLLADELVAVVVAVSVTVTVGSAADDEVNMVVTCGWADAASELVGALETSACATAVPTKKLSVPTADAAATARATRAPGRRRIVRIITSV
jgi:hypothetical protein